MKMSDYFLLIGHVYLAAAMISDPLQTMPLIFGIVHFAFSLLFHGLEVRREREERKTLIEKVMNPNTPTKNRNGKRRQN